MLAHDMRNPLSALLTNIHFVKSVVKQNEPDVEEALSDSALSCTILSQLIGNLDVLGRAFLTVLPDPRPTAVRQAAGEAVLRMAAQATLAGIEIRFSPGTHAPTLLVEPNFFGRAIDNLLANALQYSPAQGHVIIEFDTRDGRGSLIMADSGPTVPRELRELVLTGEGQVSAKQRFDARYGRGLGLYCAAQAARISGAQIAIGERDGRSWFELSGPLVV